MFSEKFLKEIARRYEALESRIDSPRVHRAYRAFIDDVNEQFRRLPVIVEYTETDPYKNSKEMFEDIDKRGVLRVYTGGAPHPLLTGLENARFRAVHDYYGHYEGHNSFSATGEQKAYQRHKRMFSAAAIPALFTETIGQLAVYFYGSHPKQYAIQKAVIL